MKAPNNFQGIIRIGQLSNDGVFMYDLVENKFTYFNNKLSEIFDTDGDSIRNTYKFLLSLVKAEDVQYLQSKFIKLKEDGCITSTEFRLDFPNGMLRHLMCDAYMMENDTTIIGFVKDVTKTKEHEEFMINYGARKDTLLDMTTHNLAGPLNMSKQILEWVQKMVGDSKAYDITSQLELISESTQECINIVNDFLKEEHQHSALTYVRKTRFDLLEKSRAVLDKLIEINKDKHFRLISDSQHLNISTDSVKFFQVLHNVISNSIKFTPADGHIDIKIIEEENHYTVEVQDDGIGIPSHLQPLIFSKRSLAGRTGLKGEASTGLGLFIVKQLVEIMGGTIWFESEENKGTSFFIKLPKE